MGNINIFKAVSHIIALALTVSEILKLKIFDYEKLGHGHGV